MGHCLVYRPRVAADEGDVRAGDRGQRAMLKTQQGTSPYQVRHLPGSSSTLSWSSTHWQEFAPIANASTPAKNGPNRSAAVGVLSSHSKQWCSSAMNPSMLVAVTYEVLVTGSFNRPAAVRGA